MDKCLKISLLLFSQLQRQSLLLKSYPGSLEFIKYLCVNPKDRQQQSEQLAEELARKGPTICGFSDIIITMEQQGESYPFAYLELSGISSAKDQPIIEIDMLKVRIEKTGEGYGRLLMFLAIDIALHLKANKIILTDVSNIPLFYRKFGFQRVGFTADHYLLLEHFSDHQAKHPWSRHYTALEKTIPLFTSEGVTYT